MVVYADVLLLTNFYVDYLLLLATEKLSGATGRFWRRMLGGFVASLFSLTIYLPSLGRLMELGWKCLCALMTIFITYGPCRPHTFLRRCVAFLAATYAFAGLFLLLQRWTSSENGILVRGGTVYLDLSPFMLVGFTTVCYLALTIYRRLIRRSEAQEQKHELFLSYKSNSRSIPVYYDSGNRLTDPLSGRPVLVVDRRVAGDLLPPEEYESMLSPEPDGNAVHGFRLIPFQSVGGNGLMPAFQPDAVKLDGRSLGRCYVALSPAPIREGFDGLIGPDLMEYEEDSLCCVK